MKEFLLLPAVGGIFIFMYEMLKKFDAFCDANRQNLWLEEDAVPEEKEESAEQVMDDCLSSSVSAERNGRLEKLLAAFQREKKVQNFRDLFTSILILLAASVMGYFFNSLGFANANIMTVFVFAVQLIAVLTNHRTYSMIAAVLSVLIFNFLFTTPRYTFHAYGEGYPVTFLIMFGIAFLTGTLALKLKNQAKQSEMVAFRTKILFDTNQILQCARGREEIISKTGQQLRKLLGRNVIFYSVKDHELEKSKVFMMEDREWSEQQKLKKVRVRNIVLNLVCICLAGSGLWWTATYFWRYVNYEVTNDAFVDQYVAPLNVRASGYIKEVCFKEHQYVRQGDTLLVLDNREYQIKVKEAEAALLDAHGSQEVLHSGIETAHTNIAVQDANIAEAKTKLWQLEQDYHRFERLLKEESVPEQQFEQIKAAYEAAKARNQALVAQKQSVLSQYTETSKKTTSAEATILRKEADLDLAKLNLSYTVLTAPYDGYMGRRTLEPGQYVQTGQTISYLVRNKDKWITANYKETQIANIYIGQQVRIKVDAVPGKIFHGEVTAISEATGSKYSLVPTDNSAGNFVKVQQRIPVRIELEDVSSEEMAQLRAGMMVETEALRK